MKESQRIGKWNFKESDLLVAPELLIEHAKKTDRLAGVLLEGAEGSGCHQASLLLSRIEVMLQDASNDVEKLRRKEELLKGIGLGPTLGFSLQSEMDDALKRCHDSVFKRRVRCATCDPFPPDLAILVDLTFLPDVFFDPMEHQEMKKNYVKMVEKPSSSTGSFRESMHWGACCNFGCRFKFGGDDVNTHFFVQVLEHFLVKYGGKDEYSKPILWEDWSLGFLSTVVERQQDPHIDYEHERLTKYKRMGRRSRNKKGKVLLPWSFDLPLSGGGLRLAFYGIDDPDDPSMLLETPVEMKVPPKHVMLWRGDCLHGGSLLDGLGRSGFRMHGCLPLAPSHVGCGKDASAKIEWHGPGSDNDSGYRNRYSHRLKKLDGTSFYEEDEVRYAADVVEKFKLEEQTFIWKSGAAEQPSKKARRS